MTSRSDLSVVFTEPNALTERKVEKSLIKVVGARDIENQIWLPPAEPFALKHLSGPSKREKPANDSISLLVCPEKEEMKKSPQIEEEFLVEDDAQGNDS